MLSRVGALVVLVAIVGTASPIGPATAAADCSRSMELGGFCSTSDGSSLSISGSRQTTTNNSPTTPRVGILPQDGTSAPPPSEEPIRVAEWDCPDDRGATRCVRKLKVTEEAPIAPEAPDSLPAVTISDLVQFTPEATVLAAEPGNVGVAGMPTNFAAAASVQTRTGSLFGVPVVVRFTPVGYDYTFGDGESATTTTAGQTWEALGQAPFTPTPTSHTYRQRGTYPARVDTRYTAEIDLGTGWIPVSGQLTSRGLTVAIRIFEARTALVAHTCDEDPDGPGC